MRIILSPSKVSPLLHRVCMRERGRERDRVGWRDRMRDRENERMKVYVGDPNVCEREGGQLLESYNRTIKLTG